MSKKRWRCTALDADGKPCGIRTQTWDGGDGPFCHVHQRQQAGLPPMGQPFVAKKRTPEEVIELLMHSKDEAVRLRAADLFLKRQEVQRACPICAAEHERDRVRQNAVHRMTHAQRVRLRQLLEEVAAIRDAASAQMLTYDIERGFYTDEPDMESSYVPGEASARTTTTSPTRGGYATAEDAIAANPDYVVIEEIDGRFFAENPDDEE